MCVSLIVQDTKQACSLLNEEIYSWKKISVYIKKDGNALTLKDLQLICWEQKQVYIIPWTT